MTQSGEGPVCCREKEGPSAEGDVRAVLYPHGRAPSALPVAILHVVEDKGRVVQQLDARSEAPAVGLGDVHEPGSLESQAEPGALAARIEVVGGRLEGC